MISNENTGTGLEDCIANGIPSRAFRYAAESKNVLQKAGSLYVGTGETRTTTMKLQGSPDAVISYDSFKTQALDPPTGNGRYVLSCVVSGGVVSGFGWYKITVGDNGITIADTPTVNII